jgi:hypothetical protein
VVKLVARFINAITSAFLLARSALGLLTVFLPRDFLAAVAFFGARASSSAAVHQAPMRFPFQSPDKTGLHDSVAQRSGHGFRF